MDSIQERFAGYIRAVENLRIEDWVIDGDEAIMWEKDDNYPVKSFKYRDDPAAISYGAGYTFDPRSVIR